MSDSEEYDSEGERRLIRKLKKDAKELEAVREGERKLTKDLKKSTRDPSYADFEKLMKRTKKCKICSKVSSLLCGQCQTTVYCSKQCQQSDWENHKRICE